MSKAVNLGRGKGATRASIAKVVLTLVIIGVGAFSIILSTKTQHRLDDLTHELSVAKADIKEVESKYETTGGAIYEFYEEFGEVVEIYDGNVEIYNQRLEDLTTKQNEIIDNLNAVVNYLK